MGFINYKCVVEIRIIRKCTPTATFVITLKYIPIQYQRHKGLILANLAEIIHISLLQQTFISNFAALLMLSRHNYKDNTHGGRRLEHYRTGG